MPIVGVKSNAGAFGLGWSAVAPEDLGGMVLMKPSTVDKTGASSSATIQANGSVAFTSCETLSLNGVFTTDYDNYTLSIRANSSTAATVFIRFRANGSDNSTANSYTYQYLIANDVSVSGARTTLDLGGLFIPRAVQRSGCSTNIYGPYLAQPTAYRSVSAGDLSSAVIEEYAGTHNQSTSYDGFTIFVSAGVTFSGLVSVYGLVGT
jgi:hypothetical protein